MFKRVTQWIFYPFLISVYPIVYLLAINPQEVQLTGIIRPLILSVFLAVILIISFFAVFKNWYRAALFAAILLVLFFCYGHVYSLIKNLVVLGFVIGRHRYLMVLWAVLAVLGFWWVAYRIKHPANIGQFLNLITFVLLAYVVVQYSSFQLHVSNIAAQDRQARMKELNISTITSQLTPPKSLPDIYYIILDAYSRADVLQAKYNLDNTGFIAELQKRGFYVAQCSQSNYPRTGLSVASSLNMDYLGPIGQKLIDARKPWQSFGDYMRGSIVGFTLKELGYSTVSFATGHPWADVYNADYYYSLKSKPTISLINPNDISSFEDMLIDTTALSIVDKQITAAIERFQNNSKDGQSAAKHDDDGGDVQSEKLTLYRINKFTLQQLSSEVPYIPSPKFVYAHVLSTHNPYVFALDGEYNYYPTDEGYTVAIRFTNQRILEILDLILSKPGPKPIIILQGDHGKPTDEFRSPILNAYYLPDGGNEDLYPAISPVNSFRVVLNRYFGANLSLLEDISYDHHTTSSGEYQFDPVPDINPDCAIK